MNQDSEINEEFVISEYKDKIFYYSLKKTGNIEAAKDITQETLFALINMIRNDKIRNPGSLSYLALRISKNKVADYFIGKEKEKRIYEQIKRNFDPKDNTPLNLLIDKEEREKIKRLVHRLKPLDRKIICLYFNDNKSPQEIASILNLSSHYVSVRKNRAIKKIMKWVSPGGSVVQE